METEHSLLDQISRKESELKQQCDVVCRQAEDRIHDARVRARKLLDEAETNGAAEASRCMQAGLDELTAHIRAIHAEGDREAKETLLRGEKKVHSAVNRITEMVLG